jgi:hypothetical protein
MVNSFINCKLIILNNDCYNIQIIILLVPKMTLINYFEYNLVYVEAILALYLYHLGTNLNYY